MNEAIKLAIKKGGYGRFNTWYNNPGMEVFIDDGLVGTRLGIHSDSAAVEAVLLDPAFWVGLGKALGWGDGLHLGYQPMWNYHAHRYLDVKLTGGDEEKFWKELLKQQ